MNRRGMVALEFGIFIAFVGALLFHAHVFMMFSGNERAEKLEKDKRKYRGELQWKSY